MPTATNPTTGEKYVWVAGKWIPVPGTAKAETAPPEAEADADPGFVERYITGPIIRGAGAALGAAGVGLNELGLVEAETAAGMIAKGEEWRQSAPRTPEEEAALAEITEAPTLFEGAKAAVTNPGALVQIGIESLPQSVPSLILGLIGATAGSLVAPGLGTAVGLATGTTAGSYATEYASSMAEVLREAGANPERPEDVAAALLDQNIMAQARERALRRGVPVAAFDALSGGMAGRLVSGATGLGSFVGRSVGEATMQGGLGAAGEADAQLRAGEEFKPGEIIAEGAAEIPGGVVETAIGAAGHRRGAAVRPDEVGAGAGAAPDAAVSAEDAELLAIGRLPDDQAVAAIREKYGVNGIKARKVLRAIREEGGTQPQAPAGHQAGEAAQRPEAPAAAPQKPTGAKGQSEAIAEKAKANAAAMLRGKWLPVRESEDEDSPVVGYVNEETGEQRTVEEHRAGAESPLSGLEPVLPAPEEIAEQVSQARKEAEKPQGSSAISAPKSEARPAPQSFYPPPSAERRERLAERAAQAAKFPNVVQPVQPKPRNAPTFEELKRGPQRQPEAPWAAKPAPSSPVIAAAEAKIEPASESPSADQGLPKATVGETKIGSDSTDTPSGSQQFVDPSEVVTDLVTGIGARNSSVLQGAPKGADGNVENDSDLLAVETFRKELERQVKIPADKSRGDVNALLSEAARDGAAADASIFGDSRYAHAIRSSGFQALPVESKPAVQAAMRKAINDRKVRRAIIQLAPVDVVDELVGEQGATKHLLSDDPVLLDRFSAALDDPIGTSVARFIDSVASGLPRAFADRVAKKVLGSGDSVGVSPDTLAAVSATDLGQSGSPGESVGSNYTQIADGDQRTAVAAAPNGIARNKARKAAAKEDATAVHMDRAREFVRGSKPLTSANLAKHLDVKPAVAKDALKKLVAKGEIRQNKDLSYRRKPIQKKPQTFSQFAASLSGLEIRHRAEVPDAPRLVPGYGPLFRKGGIDPDRLREAAIEAGYVREDADANDVLRMLNDENRGRKHHRGADEAEVQAEREKHAADQDRERYEAARQEVTDAASGAGVALTEAETHEAALLMLSDGMTADAAIEWVTINGLADVAADNPQIGETFDDDHDLPIEFAPAAQGEPDETPPAGRQGRADEREPEGDARAEERLGAAGAERPAAAGEVAPRAEKGAEGFDQLVLPGAERSAQQAMDARKGKGKTAKAPQKPADEGIFASPKDERQQDIEAPFQALRATSGSAAPPTVDGPIRIAANVVAGNLNSPEMKRLRAEVEPQLRALVQRLAGDRANLDVFDVIRGTAGDGAEFAVGGVQMRNLIGVALLDGERVRPRDELRGTVRHEVVHFLKEAGVIPAPAWAALEAKAPQWRRTFGIDEEVGWSGLDDAAKNEEAIAEAYRHWAAGSLKLAGSPLSGMRWIKRFLDGLRGIVAKALGIQKLPRPGEVFQAIERGDYAGPATETADEGIARLQVSSLAPGALLRDTNRGVLIEDLNRGNVGLLSRVMGPNMRGRAGVYLDRARRLFQDRFIYVRRAQEEAEHVLGRPLNEDEDAYRAEELYYGRVGEQKFRVDKDFKEPIVEAMHNAGLTLDEVDDFLTARHAAERNDAVAEINPAMPDGGSGMTNAEAAAILAGFNPEKRQALDRIGELVDQMMARRLENMVDSGIISAQEAGAYRSKYQHYVPLRGKPADPDGEVEAAIRPTQGRGFMGDRRREKRAMGRESRAPHVLATAFTLADEAIVRGEKNRVGQALLNLAMAAPDPDLWKVNPVEREAYMAKLADGRQQVRYRYRPKTMGKNIVSVRIDGREFRVELADPDVLRAFANLGGGDLNVALKGLGWITQNLSKLNTMWSPEFIMNNAFMDFQSGLINLGREEQAALRRQVASNWLNAYRGAVHYLGSGRADTDWSRWAQEFRRNGGQTAFNPITDSATQAKDIEAAVRELEGRNASRARRALHTLGSTIERWNTGVDNAVRLSTYAALRERGYTPARAASVAKNLTINFNRKGEMGPALNALFMFYNAGTQGTAVLASAIYRSKKVRQAVAGIVVLGAIQEIMGGMWDPPDDDKDGLGLSVYDRIPDWQKKSNIIIPYGPEPGDYVMIRMPYGYNFFHNLGRLTAAFIRGASEPDGKPVGLGKTISKLAGAFVDAMVPPGLGDTLVPSVAAPFVDIWKNEDFFGKPVMPTKFPGDDKPDSQTYFPSVNPYAKATADFLNRVTGGNEFRPGLVDISPESISHVLSTYAGSAGALVLNLTGNARKAVGEALGVNAEDPQLDVSDVPFARKIFGTASPWQVRDITYQRIAEVELLADEAKGTDDRAKQARRENRRLLALTDDARKTRKGMSNLRKERRRILEDDAIPTPEQRRRTDRIDERERELMAAFNRRYLKALAPPQP